MNSNQIMSACPFHFNPIGTKNLAGSFARHHAVILFRQGTFRASKAMPRVARVNVISKQEEDQYAPLARAILGGLTLSGLVTVFLVPTAYLLIHRKEERAPVEVGAQL